MKIKLTGTFRHNRFVKTPLIKDVLHLQCYLRGQWVQLAWSDKPSRYYGMSESGVVTAFHYPRAVSGFNSYCSAENERKVDGLKQDYYQLLRQPGYLDEKRLHEITRARDLWTQMKIDLG